MSGLEKIAPAFAEYGLAGLVIFALFVLLFWVLHSHSKERGEWRTQVADQHKEATKTASDGHQVIRDLSTIIAREGNRNRG